jgi:hypothetical protein
VLYVSVISNQGPILEIHNMSLTIQEKSLFV